MKRSTKGVGLVRLRVRDLVALVVPSRRAPTPPAGAAGLGEFEVLAGDVPAAQRLKDPDGHVVVVKEIRPHANSHSTTVE
jgi:hypothetical protein